MSRSEGKLTAFMGSPSSVNDKNLETSSRVFVLGFMLSMVSPIVLNGEQDSKASDSVMMLFFSFLLNKPIAKDAIFVLSLHPWYLPMVPALVPPL